MNIMKRHTNVTGYNKFSRLVLNCVKTGVVTEVTIAAMPTFLVMSTLINHAKKPMNPVVKDSAKIVPKYVAAPLPPLNW